MRQFNIGKHFTLKKSYDVPLIRQQFELRLGNTFKIVDLKENQNGLINFRILPRGRNVSFLRTADIKAQCEFVIEGDKLRILCFGSLRPTKETLISYAAVLAALLSMFVACSSFGAIKGEVSLGELAVFIVSAAYLNAHIEKKLETAEGLFRDFL